MTRDDWDYDSATCHQPSTSARAIVSVAFSRAEFDVVTAEARRRGMKLSTYIRETTLRCQPLRPETTITTSLGGFMRGTRTQAGRPRLLRWLP